LFFNWFYYLPALSQFDDDNIIPTFGFGDIYTQFIIYFILLLFFFRDKSVFPFFPDHDPVGFEEVLSRYRFITPGVQLSGPTSFVPLIERAIEIVKKNKSVFI
jgi:E3 ubiquitin-protein ligase RGLG